MEEKPYWETGNCPYCNRKKLKKIYEHIEKAHKLKFCSLCSMWVKELETDYTDSMYCRTCIEKLREQDEKARNTS